MKEEGESKDRNRGREYEMVKGGLRGKIRQVVYKIHNLTTL